MKPIFLAMVLMQGSLLFAQGKVGINTNSPLEMLDVNGNTNLRGVLKINGNAGTSGQVLMSKGDNAVPVWSSMALSGGGRFSCDISNNTALTGRALFELNAPSASQLDTLDLGPSLRVVGTDFTVLNTGNINNHILINRAGLYHFEGSIRTFATILKTTDMFPRANIILYEKPLVGSDRRFFLEEVLMERVDGDASGSASTFHNSMLKFSLNLHMAAGSKVYFLISFSSLEYPLINLGVSSGGYVSGYFVAE